MTMLDKAVLVLEADADSDGNTETAEFHFTTNVQMQKEMRTSFLLNNSLDRVLGALDRFTKGEPKRQGVNVDVGGGRMAHNLSFEEPDGGSNQWGDGGGAETDATGESARRKAEVLQRYLKSGTYDSASPAELRFGEYNTAQGGAYGTFIPVAVERSQITVTAEDESSINGQISLFEVAFGIASDPDSANARRDF